MTYLTKNLAYFSNLDGMQAICAEKCVRKKARPLRRSRARFPLLSLRDIFPRSGGSLSSKGSQAINLNAKVLSAMRKIPVVLLALPLGELAKPEALTERAYAVALSAKGAKCSKNFPAAPPLPQEAGVAAAVCLYAPFP